MRLNLGRQAEGRSDGVLTVEALIVQLFVVDIKQRMTNRAIQQRTFAVERLIFQPRQGACLRHHADMQAAVEHALLDFIGRDHADLNLHVRPALLQLRQRVSDAHVGQGDQVVGQADGQFAAQVLVQAVDLGAKTFQRTQ